MPHSLKKLLLATVLMPLVVQSCSCGDEEPGPARILSFTAEPQSALSGQTVTLAWSVADATSVSISAMPGGSIVANDARASGSIVSPAITAETVFVLTAFGEGGNAMSMKTVSIRTAGNVAILSFDADPLTIDAPGASSVLSWSVQDALSITIRESGGGTLTTSTEQSGEFTVMPTAGATTYVLTAEGPGGPVTDTVTVRIAGAPVIVSFVADPPMIDLGENSRLTWQVTGATEVDINDARGTRLHTDTAASGMFSVSPSQNESYVLVARNAAGLEVSSTPVMVGVNRGARILSFTASPDRVDYGDASRLQWEVVRADRIEISAGGDVLHLSTDASGEFVVRPEATTEYLLTAVNGEGNSMLAVTVTVDPTSPRVLSFTANPNPALIGTTSALDWSTAGSTELRVLDEAGLSIFKSAGADGSVDVTVTSTRALYTLEATNVNGTTRSTVIVLGENLPQLEMDVTPLTFVTGPVTATVTWNSTGTGTRLELDGTPAPGFVGTSSGSFNFQVAGTTRVSLYADNAVASVVNELTIHQLIVETEPNDTPGTATPLPGDGGGAAGTISGQSEADFYSVLVVEGGNVFARVTDENDGCLLEASLTFYDANGGILGLANNSQTDCPSIDPRRDSFAADLEPGMYFVAVRGDSGLNYRILVTATPPACGDSILERRVLESCDDGNTQGSDGCDSSCQIEPYAVVTGVGQYVGFTAVLEDSGRIDYYAVDMLSEGYIFAELSQPVEGRCDLGGGGESNDSVLELLDAQARVLGSDDDDGISSCARIDPAYDGFAFVPAGRYYLRVFEDGNDAALGPYVIRISTRPVGCGNALLDSGEVCDDGNLLDNDGCSSACTLEGMSEAEPNNTRDAATPFLLGELATGDLTLADADFYSITVPAGVHLDVYATVGSFDSCPVDPELRIQLLNSAGTLLATNIDGGPDENCGRIWPYTTNAARAVAAGTYYIRVNETGDNAPIGRYYLRARVLAPGCGNTILEDAEQCEDGNLADGDGCSSTCTFEQVLAVTLPTVAPIVFGNSIDPSYQRDAILLNVSSESYLFAQTFAPTIASGRCDGTDTAIRLFAADGTQLGADGDSGVDLCSFINAPGYARLAAGAYWLAVEESGMDRSIPYYELSVVGTPVEICGNGVAENTPVIEQCDDGNLVSGDGCDGTCAVEPVAIVAGPPASSTYSGAIAVPAEHDLIRLDVAVPSMIIAETGVPTIGTCSGDDTFLSLLGPDARTVLVDNDDIDGANNRCSRINGLVTAAARVEAGTYFLRARDYYQDSTITDGVIAAYQLSVELRALNVCGNSLLEASNAEFCDDGNTVGGDGCAANCTFEPVAVVDLVAGTPVTVNQALAASTEVHTIRLNVPQTVYVSAELFAPAPSLCTTVDPLMRIFDASAALLGSDNDDGVASCPLLNRAADPFMRLTPGTYYLTVEENGRNSIVGAYAIVFTPTVPDVCGDSILEPANMETCDDGNAVAGDGCSAICQVEILDTVVLPGPQYVRSDSLPGATNIDTFQLNVTVPTYVRIETYSAAPDCTSIDTFLRLLDSNFVSLGTDDQDGRSSCSLFNPEVDPFALLQPGTYYVQVEETGRNAPIPAYQLYISSFAANVCGSGRVDTGEQCDDGNLTNGDGCSATCQLDAAIAEVEPNNTAALAMATPRIGAGVTTMTGAINPLGDNDYYRIEVPAGQFLTLHARTYSAQGNYLSTCNDQTDTRLRLYAANGTTVLEDNDDINGASNRCSFINGGVPDTDPSARLVAGVYYLRVSYYSDNTPGTTLPYFLHLELR